MSKVLRSLFLIAILFGCGVPHSEHEALQNQNIELQNRIDRLNSRLSEVDYMANHTQVMLANTELKELTSAINGQNYKIKVSLPKGYASSNKTYPVLYVTDAETNFGGISYIVQRLIKDRLIPPILVVGIAYGVDYSKFYELRSRDLTPVTDIELRMGGNQDPTGGAPLFCDFISQELFPFVEKHFRANPNGRTIYGHSYGGLFGTYAFLNRPELFDQYLILSPSLWFKNNLMNRQLDTIALTNHPKRIYMASGELEGRIDDLQREFIDRLSKKKPIGLTYKGEVMANETHRTIFGPGFTNGMRYLFEQ